MPLKTIPLWFTLFFVPLSQADTLTEPSDCIDEQTRNVREKMAILEQDGETVRANKQSVVTYILEQRRLQEEWCKAETHCKTDQLDITSDYIYGKMFAQCIKRMELESANSRL